VRPRNSSAEPTYHGESSVVRSKIDKGDPTLRVLGVLADSLCQIRHLLRLGADSPLLLV